MTPQLERRFVQANRALLIMLLAAMVVVTFVNVVMRYLGESSFLWGEEVGRHLMIWLAFIGGGLALRNGAHIGVDSLERVAASARGAHCARSDCADSAGAFCRADDRRRRLRVAHAISGLRRVADFDGVGLRGHAHRLPADAGASRDS